MRTVLAIMLSLAAGTARAEPLSTSEFLALVASGQFGPVRDALLENWPLIDEVDESGRTALIYAIENAPHLVQYLLGEFADPNVYTTAGWTPLAYAVRLGNSRVVASLIDSGARPTVPLDGSDLIDQLLAEHPSPEIEALIHRARESSWPQKSGFLAWAYDDPVASRECGVKQRYAEWLAKKLRQPLPTRWLWTTGGFTDPITPSEALYRLNQVNSFANMYFHGNIEGERVIQGLWQDGQAIYVNTVYKSGGVFCVEIYPSGF